METSITKTRTRRKALQCEPAEFLNWNVARYTARNENFVLVVLASPFDSIAHRALWLLAPDSLTPISRRDIKGEALG